MVILYNSASVSYQSLICVFFHTVITHASRFALCRAVFVAVFLSPSWNVPTLSILRSSSIKPWVLGSFFSRRPYCGQFSVSTTVRSTTVVDWLISMWARERLVFSRESFAYFVFVFLKLGNNTPHPAHLWGHMSTHSVCRRKRRELRCVRLMYSFTARPEKCEIAVGVTGGASTKNTRHRLVGATRDYLNTWYLVLITC